MAGERNGFVQESRIAVTGDVGEDGWRKGGGVLQTPQMEGCGVCGGHGEGDVGDEVL